MRRVSASRPGRAFTLIELLIALTIFSVIAVSIYSVFRVGVRLWLGNNAAFESSRAARLFFDTAASDLRNSFVYPGSEVTGTADTLSFMAFVTVGEPEREPHIEMARVFYRYDREAGVVIRKAAFKTEGFDPAYAKATEFEAGDGEASFSYCYNPPVSGGPYEWRDLWKAKDKLPRGVRIRCGELEKLICVPMGELGTGD